MVTFFFDDAIAKVWFDDSTRCLYTKVQRTLSTADLKRLSKTVCGVIKKVKRQPHGLLCSVTDMQSCENWSTEMVRDLVEHVISAEYKAGITRKFVVRPTDSVSRRALVYGLVSVPNMNTSVHDSHELSREIQHFRITSEAESPKKGRPLQRLIKRIVNIGSRAD
jgi:hypothetical protein